jgi:hypothetical protein
MALHADDSKDSRLVLNNGDSQGATVASMDAASLQAHLSKSSLGNRAASGSQGGSYARSQSLALSPRARRGSSISSSPPYGPTAEKEHADAYFSDLLSYRYAMASAVLKNQRNEQSSSELPWHGLEGVQKKMRAAHLVVWDIGFSK